MKLNIEVTDTFGGESNYDWVRRTTVDVPDDASDLTIVRRAKLWAGWNGLRCNRDDLGDLLVLRPRGICQIMFVTVTGGDDNA